MVEFGGLGKGDPEDAEGLEEGFESGGGKLFMGSSDFGKTLLIGFKGFPIKKELSPGGFEYGGHFAGGFERIPEAVVIEDAGQI